MESIEQLCKSITTESGIIVWRDWISCRAFIQPKDPKSNLSSTEFDSFYGSSKICISQIGNDLMNVIKPLPQRHIYKNFSKLVGEVMEERDPTDNNFPMQIQVMMNLFLEEISRDFAEAGRACLGRIERKASSKQSLSIYKHSEIAKHR